MIDAYFRHSPKAMAVQMPLPFSEPKWNSPRPTRRIDRLMRAVRSAAIKKIERIQYATKIVAPQWFRDAKKAAADLAKSVKDACLVLLFN
ncbi:hypothetical protein [Ottowia testudinis]|uniref:Uncharacterized protein n=1 Tax=Ottowia testudinis TaxID=2816950 RepID=A0A975H2L1_9BURK|nr:hypothetical protein [Ottowia testudinis]QTD44311.1 hypothetical protein J1M35_14480 [Ottowia testudinis]